MMMRQAVNKVLRVINWLLLLVGVGILLFVIGFAVLGRLFADSYGNTVIYWWAISYTDTVEILLGLLLPVFVLFAPVWIVCLALQRMLNGKLERSSRAGALASLLLMASGVCACANIANTDLFPSRLLHMSTAHLDNHYYHLAVLSNFEAWNQYFFIYECDAHDLFCERIYSCPPGMCGEYDAGYTDDAVLVSDAQANTVTMRLAGVEAFIYEPQD